MNSKKEALALRLGRWLAVCVFFFAFPLFLINLGIRHALDRNWDAYTGLVARQAGDMLERLRARGDENVFLYRELKSLGERLDGSTNLRETAADLCGRLERAVPGLFEIFVVDARNAVVWPERLPMGVSAYQIRQLCTYLGSDNQGGVNKHVLKNRISLYAYFLSDAPPFIELSAMSMQQRVAEISPTGLHTYFGFWFGRKAGVLALMNRKAFRKWQFLQFLINRIHHRQSMCRFGISRYGAAASASDSAAVSRRREALAWLEDSSEDAFCIRDDRLYLRLNLDPSWRAWAEATLDVSRRGDVARKRVLAFSAALFLTLSAISFGLLVAGWKIPMALKLRLMVLFAMATGLPLSGLAVAGYDNLQKTRDLLIESGRRQLLENLRAVETGFSRFGRVYASRLSRLRDSCYLPGRSFDFPRFAEELKNSMPAMNGKTPVVILRSGKIIRPVELSGSKDDRETMLEVIGTELMRRFNRGLGIRNEESEKVVLASLVLDDRTARNMMMGVIRSRGQITHLNLGTEDKLAFMDFILDATGGAAGAFFVTWLPRDLAFSYLRHDILHRQRMLAHSRLFAVHDWNPARTVPKGAADIPWLKRFVERLRARRTELYEEVSFNGGRWLLGGIPGRELQEYSIVQALPLDRLVRPVDGLRSDLIWGGALCLLLSLGVAAALARQILRPVAVLTSGVDAMRAGRFKTRLPVLDQDEFGSLTVSFNQALERLEELSTAKAFQERLFPVDTLVAGNASVTGICQTATELGGDYFDYFDIGEGRVVILIGDVAGHGAGSALLMAMAKGFVSVESRRDSDPAHVLAGLNEMIFTAMSRRLMMSMCYGLLQVDTGLLRIANAGHCPPILVGRDATEGVELITAAGYPLGTRRSPGYKCMDFRLVPGDRVWFFTDGFPESIGARGEPLGYPALADMIATVKGADGRSRCRELHRICAAHRSGKPQTDDMTSILLEYQTTA